VVGVLPQGDAARAEAVAVLPPADGDAEWIAVGIGHHGEHERSPLWWTSSDGATWIAGKIDPITADGPASGFVGVARSGDGVAALGQAYSGVHGNARPLVWRRGADGALDEVPILRELFGGPRAMSVTGMAGDASGFVASGGYIVGGTWTGGLSSVAAAVWTSSTGATWARHPDDPQLTSSSDEVVLTSAIAAGDGTRVIVGTTTPTGPGPSQPAIWRSTGDDAWTRVTSIDSDPALETDLTAVAYAPAAGFVAAGLEDGRGVAFVSPDGIGWIRRDLDTGSKAEILDATSLENGVGVTWRDEKGAHLTVLERDRLEPSAAPPLGDVVHLAQAGDETIALVSSGGTVHVYRLDTS
jgi:hypothetical protein